LLILLFCPNYEKVLSTIHLFGKKVLGPFWGIDFLAHLIIASSGAGLGGWRTISAVHPSALSTQPAPLSRPV
jgi:hypothetical protein